MAFTPQDLDALDQAIATGEFEVDYNGRRVRYRSVTELLRARAHVAAAVAAQSSTGSIPTSAVAEFTRD